MLRSGIDLSKISVDLDLKLRSFSEDKKLELVRASVQDCVGQGRSTSFKEERFEGVLGSIRLENILKPAELTPDELTTALTTTTVLYNAKRNLHHGLDREVAATIVNGVSYGDRFRSNYDSYKTPVVMFADAVRNTSAYRLLVVGLKRLYCTCSWDAGIFCTLRGYFEETPYFSFLVFQSVFLLVGNFENFPVFSEHFAIPGSMLSLYHEVLSSDFVLNATRLSENVDSSSVKVAKFLYRHRLSAINLSWFAVSVINDPALAGSRFDFAFGFLKERPLEFIRYSFDFFFKKVGNATLAIEAPKDVVETFKKTFENMA